MKTESITSKRQKEITKVTDEGSSPFRCNNTDDAFEAILMILIKGMDNIHYAHSYCSLSSPRHFQSSQRLKLHSLFE